jgi:prepilin-type processing-associated H-X9-DG protein
MTAIPVGSYVAAIDPPGGTDMPKTSKDTAPDGQEFPVGYERTAELDGYTVNFVTMNEDSDLAPMLAVLPTGRCECPHWGLVQTGRLTFTYADGHVEVYEPGDAFYTPPGHTPTAEAGSEFILFSPSDELKATDEAIQAGMAALST